ncbi:hypothetical protein KEM56_005967 [Ascosphaera pollenicola]|nr:hypothetical protein KEM56_005967 [Ascosphaera pollenicola]
MQDNHYFRDPQTKRRMLDVLFIWANLNPDIGYRQGMHEILAPVMWVVDSDSVGVQSEPEPWGDETMMVTLDSRFIEHDSFTLFAAIMQNVKALYEHGDGGNGKPADVNYESPIVARSRRIHEVMLFRVDYELAEHLAAIDILPQIFVTRWIRLLFGREFSFQEVLSMWDMIFAEGVRLELIDYICVAMLLRIRWQLLDSDYSSALSLLLKYPSPHPRHPRTFVSDALSLEKDPTIQGGSSIILKYSDRIPSFSGRSPSQRPSSFVTPPIGMSPINAPRINRRLDSLFQDVSGGVAKAVKGAVGEARRNFNAAGSHHGGGVVSHLRKSASSTESGLSPSNPSAAAMAELNKRVFKLESRSKALGSMLAEALSQFRAAQKAHEEERQRNGEETERGEKDGLQEDNKSGDEAAALPIDILLAKVQFVQVYLEDPTIPIDGVENNNNNPDSPFTIAGSEWDKMSIRSPPTIANSPAKISPPCPPITTEKSLSTIGAIETSPEATPSSSSSSPQPAQASKIPNVDGVADTVNTTQSRERRHPSQPKTTSQYRTSASQSRLVSHTRAPLSKSPFSWMLGEEKNTGADFVPSASQSRTASRSKPRGDGLFRSMESDGIAEGSLQRKRGPSLEKLGL